MVVNIHFMAIFCFVYAHGATAKDRNVSVIAEI
jgi:hypothetical protein